MKDILYIELKAPEGTYRIPAELVAVHRADYYAETNGFTRSSGEWITEVDYAINNIDELEDWLFNNTDPGDWIEVIEFQSANFKLEWDRITEISFFIENSSILI